MRYLVDRVTGDDWTLLRWFNDLSDALRFCEGFKRVELLDTPGEVEWYFHKVAKVPEETHFIVNTSVLK